MNQPIKVVSGNKEWPVAEHGRQEQGRFWSRARETARKPVCLACVAALLLQTSVLVYGLGASFFTTLLVFSGAAFFIVGAIFGKYWAE